MKQYGIFLATVAMLLTACESPARRTNEITKIEVATGYCFGSCQPIVVSIDRSLQFKYYGDSIFVDFSPEPNRGHRLYGYYTGKISRQLWDTLNDSLEAIHFKRLDTAYEHSVDDQSLEIFIHYGKNKLKHIKAQSASLPDSVANTFYFIANSYRKVRLRRATDTLQFDSKRSHLSMSNILQVKSPPPERKPGR